METYLVSLLPPSVPKSHIVWLFTTLDMKIRAYSKLVPLIVFYNTLYLMLRIWNLLTIKVFYSAPANFKPTLCFADSWIHDWFVLMFNIHYFNILFKPDFQKVGPKDFFSQNSHKKSQINCSKNLETGSHYIYWI